jgi:hypothetical protein
MSALSDSSAAGIVFAYFLTKQQTYWSGDMKNIINERILFGLLSVFVVMACGLAPSATVESPAPVLEPTASAEPAIPVDGCANPYYPAVLNASRVYKSSGTPKGEYTLTETTTEVRTDGFTVLTDYGDNVKSIEWSCAAEGLRVYSTGNEKIQGLEVDSDQFQLEVTIKNPSGVTLPAKLETGESWVQSFDFDSTGKIGENTTTGTGTSTSTYEAQGVESITTPAGTFQAMKIKSETNEDIQATFNGLAMNSSNAYETIYWFVEGVGLVRSETTGGYTETLELQSYSIP